MKAQTTIKTITTEQIEALRQEAGAAGDTAQVAVCDRALDGDDRALVLVVEAIRTAEAMED